MTKNNRGKDFFLVGLLCFIVLLLILSMYQRDRQWEKLAAVERTLAEQSRDLSTMRGALNAMQRRVQGGNFEALGEGDVPAGSVSNAFRRAKVATEQEDYAQGDWSVSPLVSTLKTITPLISTDSDASQVQSYVLEGLMTRDPDTLEWTGLIARDWTISDDGLVITFRLRNDVYFSDGEPLDSSDIVFTFDFILNEAIQAPRHRAYLEKIEKVTAPNPYEVVFTYKEPYFEALQLAGTLEIFPEHFYKEYLDDPNSFNESKGILLGSGPYQLADPKGWTPDQGNIELVRNTRYWGDVQPAYERILWRVIQNASARLTTYRNGDIDTYGARPVEYEKLKNDRQITEKSQNFEYLNPIASYSYLGWNQEKLGKPTFFADKSIRQAMTYLLDRERINEDIYLGYAEAAVSPFSPRSKQHNVSLLPRPHDLEKAAAMLKAAGFEDRDGNGVIENEDGKPFEFKLTYFQDNEDTKRMVLLIKDLFAKAKVKVIPDPQEWPVMLEMLTKKNFEVITLAWTSGIETDIFQMFHGSQALTNGDNFISYKNPELDKLIDAARAEVDPDKRMPLWQEAEKIMYEDQPYTFLFRRKSLIFIDERINNLKLTKVGLNLGIKPIEQYVPKSLQKYTQ